MVMDKNFFVFLSKKRQNCHFSTKIVIFPSPYPRYLKNQGRSLEQLFIGIHFTKVRNIDKPVFREKQ